MAVVGDEKTSKLRLIQMLNQAPGKPGSRDARLAGRQLEGESASEDPYTFCSWPETWQEGTKLVD